MVTVIRKTVTTIRETYLFQEENKSQARLRFLLWWWKDAPLPVQQTEEQAAHEMYICDADFLTATDKSSIERTMKSPGRQMLPNELSEIENLIKSSRLIKIS